MTDLLSDAIRRSARSIKIFADGDMTFCFGDWKAWKAACSIESRCIPPAEFKALPQDQRRAYLKAPFYS